MSLHFAIRTRPNGAAQDERLFRILIVEDNALQRELLKKHLDRRVAGRITLVKVEVIAAATLAAGLELAETANVTLLDLGLPDSTLEETIASIHKFRPPVIVTTGSDDLTVEKACIEAGAECVFVKAGVRKTDDEDAVSELCARVVQCLMKDLCRLNGRLTPHGYGATQC